MRRFAYSPDVNVYIDATDYGFIDVSDDVISGSVTRRVNAMSSAQLTFQNPNRKYLKKIKPMDRIVIYLTRIHQPVLVFSGYIDRSPYDQLFPGPVSLTASCTLKRLMNTYWDPALPYVSKWLYQYGWLYNNVTGTMIDPTHNLYNSDFSGGLGHLLRAVMNDVGGWPIGIKGQSKNSVHVMKLPDAFLKKTKSVLVEELTDIERQQESIDRVLKTLLTSDGIAIANQGTGTTADSMTLSDSVQDSDPLPVDVSKKQWTAAIYGERVSTDPNDKYGVAIAIASAFEAQGIPGKVGVAVSLVETGGSLDPNDRQNGGDNAMGLFQTFPKGAGGSYHFQELTDAISNPGSPVINFYPVSHQISDASSWFAKYLASHSINFTTASATEIGVWARGAQGAGDPAYASKVAAQLNTAQSLIVGAPPNVKTTNTKSEGQVGDVKTSNTAFFRGGGRGQTNSGERVGYTFRIKGNPYGDDSLLFRALWSDNVPADRISIYVPGATGQGTIWAQSWGGRFSTKKVTLETSAGGDTSFGKTTTTSTPPGDKSVSPLGIKVTDDMIIGRPNEPGSTHGVDFNSAGGTLNWESCNAVDIACKTGTPVIAVATGTIGPASQFGALSSSEPRLAGQRLHLIVGDNEFYYAHLSQINVQPNQHVTKGQVLGLSGSANGVEHLHIAVKNNWTPSNAVADDPAVIKWIGGSVSDAPMPVNSQGVLGTTGVHANQQDMVANTAATVFGVELGFPSVGDVAEALLLTGSRALANDVPLFQWVDFICKASGRNFQSMPNGDFLAFYPDHFNWSGQTPYFRISPIETIDLSIDITDEELTTHVFTTGDTYGYNGLDFLDKIASTVSSVDSPAFKTLVDVDKNFSSYNFLKRYGARPWVEERPELKNSFMQFMYGWMTFLDKWAKQFVTPAEFAFLPELFPGGIIDFPPPHRIKMYVEEVTHTFDRTSGFSTTASLSSPSYYRSTDGTEENTAMVLADGGLKSGNTKATANASTGSGAYRGPH